MKNFSQILKEDRKNYDSIALLRSEITEYINKVTRILPKNILDIIRLTEKYGLLSAANIEEIRQSNKSQLPPIADKYGMPTQTMEMLYALLKQASKSIRLLPQYQSAAERAAIEAGKLSLDDLTIDLDSRLGRNAAAKMYAPLVFKIANQYASKSRLDRPSLLSAGMMGLTDAMNSWDREKTAFKTYASYRIQQAILNDINKYGHTLSGTNWYSAKKYGAAAVDAISTDGIKNDDGEDFSPDRLLSLSELQDDPDNNIKNEEEKWTDIFKLIEDKFTVRDVDIFYRYFGLGNYHGRRQKSKDIAKEYGMSEGNIRNSVINKMIKFFQSNPKASQLLGSLKELYTESLLVDMVNMDKDMIREALYKDNTYILLEGISRWDNKQLLINAVNAACDKMDINQAKYIYDCLMKDKEFFIKSLKDKQKRRTALMFLSEVYPAENLSTMNDEDYAYLMLDIIEAAKRLKINW